MPTNMLCHKLSTDFIPHWQGIQVGTKKDKRLPRAVLINRHQASFQWSEQTQAVQQRQLPTQQVRNPALLKSQLRVLLHPMP